MNSAGCHRRPCLGTWICMAESRVSSGHATAVSNPFSFCLPCASCLQIPRLRVQPPRRCIRPALRLAARLCRIVGSTQQVRALSYNPGPQYCRSPKTHKVKSGTSRFWNFEIHPVMELDVWRIMASQTAGGLVRPDTLVVHGPHRWTHRSPTVIHFPRSLLS
ncbi:hypothetical protein EJ05DRAFT_309726 [Pseudovirgaria hyperparasitica]|uniref:Uncharacterized protein n=1 Tax=Pseudovirgaria hyperparasitica TaxID=470096 RepID=A0A6A6WC86_9PEZI|nr:uncharacterized protein EJ05DRAFT_309726 [Pseudovirgaria hyperparasitica]KAF2759789.1 hypothetical protein EJ05DRAFT_309726 [Pseudovirgaria hyperparasitica]